MFLAYGHVGSGRGKTFSEFVRVIALHGHAYPRKLHPDPPLVVVVCRRLLVKLELFNNSLSIEILQIFEIFRFRLILFNVLDLCDKVV